MELSECAGNERLRGHCGWSSATVAIGSGVVGVAGVAGVAVVLLYCSSWLASMSLRGLSMLLSLSL